MANLIIKRFDVTAAGINYSFAANEIPDLILIFPSSSPTTLLGDITFSITGTPTYGTYFRVLIGGGFDLNGNTIDTFGYGFQQYQVDSGKFWIADYVVSDNAGTVSGLCDQPFTLTDGFFQTLDAGVIIDETVTLAKLEDLTSAQIIVGSGTNRPTAVSVTGDVTISNAGVTAIGAGVIVNADVNAAAAIDRSKLGNGTADHVVINSGAGAFSSEAQLAESRGGTGLDTSASTGFATVSAGTWSVGSISEVITLLVSFEAAGGTTPSVGDFKIKMPYAGTVTEIYAYAVKAIAGTDNGTIVPKNNGGTTMTSGTITFTASDARGTAYTSTPSANNTFAAGDLLTFTTAKTTAGGLVQLSITVTRTS